MLSPYPMLLQSQFLKTRSISPNIYLMLDNIDTFFVLVYGIKGIKIPVKYTNKQGYKLKHEKYIPV